MGVRVLQMYLKKNEIYKNKLFVIDRPLALFDLCTVLRYCKDN